MSTGPSKLEPTVTLADLLDKLGGVAPARVIADPPPGRATEYDLLSAKSRLDRICELVDGALVEKPPGFRESVLGVALVSRIHRFVNDQKLGLVTPAGAPFRVAPRVVRMPDGAFASWERIPGGRVPVEPIPPFVPDLAIEFQRQGLTANEAGRKIAEYFRAGVRVIWMVNAEMRSVSVHRSPDRWMTLRESDTLDGGEVLPGFLLPLRELFAELERCRGR